LASVIPAPPNGAVRDAILDLRQSARRRESSIIRAHDLPEPDTPEGDTAFRTDSEFNP